MYKVFELCKLFFVQSSDKYTFIYRVSNSLFQFSFVFAYNCFITSLEQSKIKFKPRGWKTKVQASLVSSIFLKKIIAAQVYFRGGLNRNQAPFGEEKVPLSSRWLPLLAPTRLPLTSLFSGQKSVQKLQVAKAYAELVLQDTDPKSGFGVYYIEIRLDLY